jgi:hypothetical protein
MGKKASLDVLQSNNYLLCWAGGRHAWCKGELEGREKSVHERQVHLVVEVDYK